MALALDYTLITILLGATVIGIVSGALGCFAVLRKQSLLGDAISHAALPGVAIAFLLTLSKNPFVLLLGAMAAGWLGTLLIMLITKRTHLKQDTALGIVLSFFFGIGIFLLTMIQRLPTAQKAGLDTYLFGSASTLLRSDVITMMIFGGVALAILLLFWKEFKLLSFDPDFAHSIGHPVLFLDILLTTLIVIAIVIGLQTVGVVLMSALLIAPAAAARQWTDRLSVMVLLAAIFAILSGVIGAVISSSITKLPTGPTIVLVISLFVMISLFLSPHRGIGKDILVAARNRRRVRVSRVLLTLLRLSESHHDKHKAHSLESITAVNESSVEKSLAILKRRGLISKQGKGWTITDAGANEARRLSESNGGAP